jgi:hypothetical protein
MMNMRINYGRFGQRRLRTGRDCGPGPEDRVDSPEWVGVVLD